MSKNRVNKSVSFNLQDEVDTDLLKHAERENPLTGRKRNFSKYVKRLIEEDKKRENEKVNVSSTNNSVVIEENLPIIDKNESYSIETKKAMSSFL